MDKTLKDKINKKTRNKKSTKNEINKIEENKKTNIRVSRSLIRNKTIIVGCGRLGASIANKVSKEGQNVLIIDKEKNAFELLDESFSGYQITGDVTDVTTLESAFITSAKEIIITTGNDNINIFLANVAREIYDVPEIYVRIDNPEMLPLVENKRIETILPFQLSFDKLELIRGGKK